MKHPHVIEWLAEQGGRHTTTELAERFGIKVRALGDMLRDAAVLGKVRHVKVAGQKTSAWAAVKRSKPVVIHDPFGRSSLPESVRRAS